MRWTVRTTGTRFWVGASTLGELGSPARGIRPLEVAPDGSATLGEPVEVGSNPMFLAWGAGGVLAIVHELGDGLVSTWTVDGDAVRPLAAPSPTGAADPCHVVVDRGSGLALVANYSGSRVSAHRLAPASAGGPAERVASVDFAGDGPRRDRQLAPHPHQVVPDPARGRHLVPDLGADRIRVVRVVLDAEGAPHLAHDERDDIRLRAGSGPRHLVVAGDVAVVANELDRTASVVDLVTGLERSWTAIGAPVASELGASAIRMTRAGTVLIGDRALDAVQVLRLGGDGDLEHLATLPTGGRHPRDLELTHDERFLLVADQQSDSIAVFELDASGVPVGVVETIATPAPGCLARE
ncbi:lactonase family protein [Agromyces sp. MMS24-JH15]|uniref:lactonase family protein n=1 Tax=Agromyces sp. MMS24-JH15 TaxID=3243765 RepID=UPI003748F4AB